MSASDQSGSPVRKKQRKKVNRRYFEKRRDSTMKERLKEAQAIAVAFCEYEVPVEIKNEEFKVKVKAFVKRNG